MHIVPEGNELPPRPHDKGTCKHRGELCTRCFHDSRLSQDEEACDAYERWFTYPTTHQ